MRKGLPDPKPLRLKGKIDVGLIYRAETNSAVALSEKLARWLTQRGHRALTGPEQEAIKGAPLLRSRKELQDMDLIVVLGGDGSYLRAIRLLDQAPVPILGVNQGSLGFLTPVKSEQLFSAMESTLAGQMILSPRSLIEIEYRVDRQKKTAIALNDVVMERGRMSQLIVISMESGSEFVSEVRADGLIVAGPTGSTAYNLAAGGPLLHPSLPGFAVTPIAAHSLTSRPVVLPDHQEIRFTIQVPRLPTKGTKELATAQLIIDGQFAGELTSGAEVRIRRSRQFHWMVSDPHQSFFSILREKLKFGERA